MLKKKFRKKFVLIITLLGLLAGGTFSYLFLENPEKTSSEYSSPERGFAVQFPSEPKKTSQEMDIAGKKITFNELSSEEKEAVYAVSYIDFPKHWKWLGSDKLLTKAFEGFVENEKNIEEVLHQELSKAQQGHSQLLYRLKQNGKEVQGKFVIVGNTLYRVTVAYPLALSEKIQPETFLDSFHIG